MSCTANTAEPPLGDVVLPTTASTDRVTAQQRAFDKAAKVMIVDDEDINIRIVQKYLKEDGYEKFITVADSRDAVDAIRREVPDVLLLDVMMPNVNGLQVLAEMRQDPRFVRTPVLILTASCETSVKLKALELGAADFLTKPVDRYELGIRVRNALMIKTHQDQLASHSAVLEEQVRRRTAELARSQQEIIHCLARAAEYRDGATSKHVDRVGRYVGILAKELGFKPQYIDLMAQAAKLHDVGKIGIPDSVLQKPGKLTDHEFSIIKQHCAFGRDILQEPTDRPDRTIHYRLDPMECIRDIVQADASPLMKLAALITQTHHEKWDGSGYPLGLAGDDIPIEGRITAIADVFDALNSARPYKEPFPLDKCFEIIAAGRGVHFDPCVVDAFFNCEDQIIEISQRLSDTRPTRVSR